MTQGPIKVSAETKERVRYAAALAGFSQSELVQRAVDEYVERHARDLFEGLERARAALSRGVNASVAYALGVSEAEIDRIAPNRKLERAGVATPNAERTKRARSARTVSA